MHSTKMNSFDLETSGSGSGDGDSSMEKINGVESTMQGEEEELENDVLQDEDDGPQDEDDGPQDEDDGPQDEDDGPQDEDDASDESDETDYSSVDTSDEADPDEEDLNEIDKLLDQGLPENQRTPKRKWNAEKNDYKRVDNEYNEKEIIVLEEKGKNTFEVLPGGWIEVRHSSGMPLYLHRKTRVCTAAKPYFLGPASVRRHSIPLSAIPCLAYRRALREESEPTPQTPPVSQESASACSYNNDSTLKQRSKPLLRSIPEFPPGSNGLTPNRPDGSEIHPDPFNRKRKQMDDCDNDGPRRTKQRFDSTTDLNGEKLNDDIVKSSIDNNEESISIIDAEPSNASESTAEVNMLPLAKVATAKENNSMYSVTPSEVRKYCQAIFRFKSVKCKRFKTWSARRKHTKEQKRLQLQRPSLPEGVKLISFPIHNGGAPGDGGSASKEYIMNPQGKSSVCILHEYVQHALRKQPSYIFKELENASTPYAATVVINGMQYATGYGSSKKQAKADAAKATLEILIPQMKEQLEGKKCDANSEFDILSFFEPFGIQEVSISKWCKNFSEPPPYGLLLTCIQRNFGKADETTVKFEMLSTGSQSNKFRMEVGEHNVEVTAANKREGKQLASQHLLSKLHPHITNFGAFIKLYGNNSIKSVKEKKQEEQLITTLQSKASANSPNWAILNKLKVEMLKLLPQPAKIDPSTDTSNNIAQNNQNDKKDVNDTVLKNASKSSRGSKPQDAKVLNCDIPSTKKQKSHNNMASSQSNNNKVIQCDRIELENESPVENKKGHLEDKSHPDENKSEAPITSLQEEITVSLEDNEDNFTEREEGEASP